MTVKELKKLLEDVPDTHEVYFEYDGLDTVDYRVAKVVMVNSDNIVLAEEDWLEND